MKVCNEGRTRGAKGSVEEEEEGVREEREGICLYPQSRHIIYKKGQLIINNPKLLGTVT